MIVNESAAWGKEGEINISPENIEVSHHYFTKRISSFASFARKTLKILSLKVRKLYIRILKIIEKIVCFFNYFLACLDT